MDALLSSEAAFKIIANGNQMLNPIADKESLQRYRYEYETLLRFIRENKIEGVLFISGDRHFSELIKLEDANFYPLFDYTSSSLTAGLSNPREEMNNPHRVQGTLVSDAHNFGILRFSGSKDNRKVILECWDFQGTLRWSHEIKASELKLKK